MPDGLRSLPLNEFPKYLLFCRWEEAEDVMEIFGVIHGAMNLVAIFGAGTNQDCSSPRLPVAEDGWLLKSPDLESMVAGLAGG
jgi:hypothetical protein